MHHCMVSVLLLGAYCKVQKRSRCVAKACKGGFALYRLGLESLLISAGSLKRYGSLDSVCAMMIDTNQLAYFRCLYGVRCCFDKTNMSCLVV